jgi:hypothetical protein
VTSSIFIEGFFLDKQVVLANSTEQLVVAAVAYATSINYIHMGTSLQLLKGVFKEGWLAVRRPDENKMEQFSCSSVVAPFLSVVGHSS